MKTLFSHLTKKKLASIVVILILLASLPIALYSVKHRQETRKKAAEIETVRPETIPGQIVLRVRGSSKSSLHVESAEESKTSPPSELEVLKQAIGVTNIEKVELPQTPRRSSEGGFRLESLEEETKDSILVYKYSSSVDPQVAAQQLSSAPEVVWAEPVFIYHEFQDSQEANQVVQAQAPDTPTPTPTSEPNPTSSPTPMVTQCTPNDPSFCNGDQWSLKKIDAPRAWEKTHGSGDIIVAVVDTGVDLNHPDLKSNLLAGYDFVNNDNDPQDDVGHGTHVAGTIGAVGNNSEGVAGINWNTKILPVKVLGPTGGSSVNVSQGILWATAHGARVINLSLGGFGSSLMISDAINDAYQHGVIVIAAAGNNNGDVANTYPASDSHVISVGATSPNDQKSYYSNFGSTLDISAPGGDRGGSPCTPSNCILSTLPNSSYGSYQGTSMAAPHVAGLAALVLSVNPSFTPDQVEAVLENSADDLGNPGQDPQFGWGRINAGRALTQTDTTPLPFAKLQVGGPSKRTVGFSATVRGTYRIDQAPTKDGPWSNEGIVLTDHQPGTDGEVITGSYTPPDGYKGNSFLRVTAESQSGRVRYALGETYIDPTLTTISLPFHNSFNINVADVDGDGQEDIVLANWDRIALVNRDGTLLPGWPQAFDLSRRGDPNVFTAVGELDKNYPGKEIVAATENMPNEREFQLMAWHADGTAVDGWPTSTFRKQDNTRKRIVLADLDKDGTDEAIFTSYSPETNSSTLHVLSGNGQELGGFPQTLRGINLVPPLVADLDGNGQLEIALLYVPEGTQENYLWAVSTKGVVLPNLPKKLSDGGYSLLAATGDINGDGKDEIVVFKNNFFGFTREEGTAASSILIVDGAGQVLQKRIINTTPMNFSNLSATLSIADLAGDGKARIILSGVESHIHILDERGEYVQEPLGMGDIFFTYTTLAKKDNTGGSELIISGDNEASDHTTLKKFKSNGGPFTEESTVTFPHDYSYAFGTQNPSGIMLSGVDRNTRYNSVLEIDTDPGVWVWQQRFGNPKLASYYTNTNQHETINLSKGWNLIGVPYLASTISAQELAEKLKDLTKDDVIFISFNSTESQAKAYFTEPEKKTLNTLKTIDSGQGYWVHINSDKATISFDTVAPSFPQTIEYKEGWQLVSFPFLANNYPVNTFADKLKAFSGADVQTIGFEQDKGALAYFTDPEKRVLNTLKTLQTKKGYWLRLAKNITITVRQGGNIELTQAQERKSAENVKPLQELPPIEEMLKSASSQSGLPTQPAGGNYSADFDHNGKVDLLDYNKFVEYYRKTAEQDRKPADLNNDGKVDLLDYNAFVEQFRQFVR